MAVGCNNGNTSLLELSDSLSVITDNPTASTLPATFSTPTTPVTPPTPTTPDHPATPTSPYPPAFPDNISATPVILLLLLLLSLILLLILLLLLLLLILLLLMLLLLFLLLCSPLEARRVKALPIGNAGDALVFYGDLYILRGLLWLLLLL